MSKSFASQVAEWRRGARMRSRYKKTNERAEEICSRIKMGSPVYKFFLHNDGIFNIVRTGYTRGSHMCAETRSLILVHRAKGASRRNREI